MSNARAAVGQLSDARGRASTVITHVVTSGSLCGQLGKRTVLRFLTATVAVLLAATPTMAAKPDNPTALEISRLPPYCLDTEWFAGPKNSPRQSPKSLQWEQMMGYGFWSLHHYCWGLVSLDRFYASPLTGEARKFLVHQIVSEYYYVLNNTPPDFILRPEILLRLGEAELLRENYGEAYDAFFKARQQKPDYWPAYARWAEVLIKAKKTGDARKLVEQGLMYSPQSVTLQEMFRKLGGDPSKVEPIAAVSPPPAEAAAAASAPAAAASAAPAPTSALDRRD